MSLFGALLERKSSVFSDSLWAAMLAASASKAGVSVSATNAIRVAAAFACARSLANGVAQVPLNVYRDTEDGGKEPAKDHPLYALLHRRPNGWMTSFRFRATAVYHVIFARGFFALKNVVRGQDGRPKLKELLPLVPANVTVRQAPNYSLTYEVRGAAGEVIGTFPRDRILHLPGAPGMDLVHGADLLEVGREALGLSIAIEEEVALLHKNGGRPSGVLSFPNTLEPEQKASILKAWNAAVGGGRLFGTAVVDLGAKYERMAMSSTDAQTLENRKFQIEETCRVFGVHPQLVYHTTGAMAYAASEQNALDHVKHTLNPWYEAWGQELELQLLTEEDLAAGYSVGFVPEGLLRGDVKTRYEAYGSAIEKGWMTRNEARRKENMNPLPGLDRPLRPLNMDDGTGKPPAAGGVAPPAAKTPGDGQTEPDDGVVPEAPEAGDGGGE